MHIIRTFFLSLSILFFADFVKTDYESEFLENSSVEQKAKFKTLPIHLMVNEGETIRLPCFVDQIEGFVLLWKYGAGEDILSVGRRVVKREREERIKLEEENNGNYLVIDSATAEDSGNYVCQISDYVPLEIRHSVIVRTRPEVTVESRLVEMEEGDDVSLVCRVVSGTPAPEISWLREGRVVVLSENLLVRNVSRLEAGLYWCRADNGFTEDHRVSVQLSVAHSPVILNSSTTWLHAGGSSQVSLTCDVSSQPQAQVFWLSGDTEIPSSSRPQPNNSRLDGNVESFSLEVDLSSGLEEDQQYWCVANNSLGEARRMITLTNRPGLPSVKINQTSGLVSWTVESQTNLSSSTLELHLPSEANTRQVSITPLQTQQGYWTGSWISDLEIQQFTLRVRGINSYGAGPFSEWLSYETSPGSRVQLYLVCGLIPLMLVLLLT